jgi:hypothetical protein
MHQYVVARIEAHSRSIALCDADGLFHIARSTRGIPAVGARLTGNAPALGFALLLGESFEQVYRVTFDAVHCSRAAALGSIAPTPAARLAEAARRDPAALGWLT